MSDATPSVPAPPPKKSGGLGSLVLTAIAVIALSLGLSQAWRGAKSMMGWDGAAAMKANIDESNAAYQQALKQIEVGDSLVKTLMEAIDAQPLADFRLEQADNAREAIAAYSDAAKQFMLAGTRIDAASKSGPALKDQAEKALKRHSQACSLLAIVCQQSAEICETLVDPSIDSKEALVTRLAELGAKRDVNRMAAESALEESQELSKQNAAE